MGASLKRLSDTVAQSLSDALFFEPGTAEKFEQAVFDLGRAIGIVSQRPEKQFEEGPDNLWRLKDGRFLVIECKNGSTSTTGISKVELGQLEQALTWFGNRYGNETAVPVIIHPLDYVGPKATALKDLRIIDAKKLKLLRKAFVNFVKAIAVEGVLADEVKVKEALHAHKVSESLLVQTFSIGC